MALLEDQLANQGYTVLNPWRLGDPREFEAANCIRNIEERRQMLHKVNVEIAARNEQAIRESDAIVAVLDGVDIDSGTASEIGFAYALGKRIYGYRSDFRRSGDNDGSVVNPQVQYWIEKSGGFIAASRPQLHDYLTRIRQPETSR